MITAVSLPALTDELLLSLHEMGCVTFMDVMDRSARLLVGQPTVEEALKFHALEEALKFHRQEFFPFDVSSVQT